MMEFTLSRVCLGVCGLVLLAAVIAPITGMYDERTANMESDITNDIGKLMDSLSSSDSDSYTIVMRDILTDRSAMLYLENNLVKMTTPRGTFTSSSNSKLTSDGPYGYDDVVKFTKTNNIVNAERINSF